MHDAEPAAAPGPNPFAPSAYELDKARVTRRARWLTWLAVVALVLPVCVILFVVIKGAWPALSLDLLLQNPADKGKSGGILAPMMGTLGLVTLSVLISAPIGIAAGIYIQEYAREGRIRRLVTLGVTTLAGVPSIVHALFGVGAFVLFAGMGSSLRAAACTLAIMNLPVIIASSQQALASVPQAFREACWNLGASRWQTIRTIVLPNALGGILTGVILAVSRAAGETAPILFTGAVFFAKAPDTGFERLVPYGLEDEFMALAMHLHVIATQVSGMPPERMYATALVLMLLVVVVNSAAIVLRVRLRQRRKW